MNAAANAERHTLIDALRGLALFGILAVNIQGFVWLAAGGPSLGVLWEDAPIADSVVVFLTALLLEFKFYPIFCFCFGYGFALMARRWRAQGVNVRKRFLRRINFLLVLGLLHGTLLWFGDILSRYAIAAYLLVWLIGKGPRALLWHFRIWLVLALLWAIFSVAMAHLSPPPMIDMTTAPMMAAFEKFTYGGYLEQTPIRLSSFATMLGGWVFNIPQVMALFLCGAIVAQLGWLKHVDQHRKKWWTIFWASLALGLGPSVAQAFASLAIGADPAKAVSALEMFGYSFSPLLAPAYIAALALISQTSFGQRLVWLVTPAGRMALTVYLAESLLMACLLLGFGARLAGKGQGVLFLLAVAIYASLLAFSHWTLARYPQGPLEGWWRRYTYTDKN